jgi:predicted dehydrogenase/threonine dehydrogenase-like Zn-dependent dehydrogenase
VKQILQSLKTGATEVTEVPVPKAGRGQLLIHTSHTLVSAGTERMLVEFGKAGWIDKARQQPEKVRMVLEKIKTNGLLTTIDAVQSKLDQPIPLGYCNVGVVVGVGTGVNGFNLGDFVASNGAHAEIVSVPTNLCAKIPSEVSAEEAVFTVIASIALQGIRLVKPSLGECFVVTGLGLIGLITVQLLRANGCRVLGIDLDPEKTAMARRFGAETVELAKGQDPIDIVSGFSRNRGVDGVLLTLASKSSEPVSQAARMCRKRGRIVLVGVTGLQLNRSEFYEKELSFQVSCSYGPGRYDPEYENKGYDYPVGFVRWTEQRNFEAVLDMMANGRLDVKPLISHRFAFDDAPKAYDLLTNGNEPYLGILLNYAGNVDTRQRALVLPCSDTRQMTEAFAERHRTGEVVLGMVGAGNYAGRVLIPAFHKAGACLHTLANSGGVSGAHYARKYGFEEITTDTTALMSDDRLSTIVVATRHDSHANLVCQALQSGKHVFCEKPLALTLQELQRIRQAWEAATKSTALLLMVGFNRRFSPQIQKMKQLLKTVREPKSFIMTMNAGAIPPDHWTQDNAIGGGRIIGEACHYIDLMRYLTGSEIVSVQARRMGGRSGTGITEDKAAIILGFADGSFGTIHYYANGSAKFPKERIEVFAAGRVLQLDNFRKLTGYGWSGFKKMKLWKQDKGQAQCVRHFLDAIENGKGTPIPVGEIFEVSRVSIEVADLLRSQNT